MEYAYIYDVVLILTVVLSIFLGAKRGVLRTLVSAVVYLAAVMISGIVSEKYAETIYMDHIRSRVISVTEEKITATRQKFKDRVTDVVNDHMPSALRDYVRIEIPDINIPDEVMEILDIPEINEKIKIILNDYTDSLSDSLRDRLPSVICDELRESTPETDIVKLLLSGDIHGSAEYIEEIFLRSPLIRLVRYVLWSVTFVIIAAAGKVITSILLSVRKSEAVRSLDAAVGAAFGFMRAAMIVIVSVYLIRTFSGFMPVDVRIFSDDFISGTLIYKYIYFLLE